MEAASDSVDLTFSNYDPRDMIEPLFFGGGEFYIRRYREKHLQNSSGKAFSLKSCNLFEITGCAVKP